MVKPSPITVKEFLEKAETFFAGSHLVLSQKSGDYQNDGMAFGDIFEIAADLDLTPKQVLWVFLKKHLTAVRRGVNGHNLTSELFLHRCTDAANYIAMLAILNSCEDEEKPA